jgi:maltooligosyltrehalose trehalohydrolase
LSEIVRAESQEEQQPMPESALFEGRYGATRLGPTSVRFRLWAPAQEEVSVALENDRLLPMARSPDGWFETTADVPNGAAYRYRLSDGTLVPDPASRQQVDDVHGASTVVVDDFVWRNNDWTGRPWNETILYEIHVGAAGGFCGIEKDLPRLKKIGITAIELMPINDFPGQRNWGYDGVLPYAPDMAYGTPTDLKRLIDAAHGLDIMVFLDVVYNHFGPDGNYLSLYSPGFFRDDIKTPWGPALDFKRQEVRDFFTCNVLMWLTEYRFDGLRFDAVHAIQEQDWVVEMACAVRRSVQENRHVHLVLEHHNAASLLRQETDTRRTETGRSETRRTETGGIDAQWNDDLHNVLHVLLTDETAGYYGDYAEEPTAKLARCLAEGWYFQGQHSAYLGAARGEPSGDLPPWSHVFFLQNHDQIGNRAFGERLTSLVPVAALEAAIALQMLSPQIPMLYMGEEVASKSPFLFFTDHHNELADAVREGRRAEFAGFAEFVDPEKRERIPDPNAADTFTASKPVPDPEQAERRLALYRALIELRQREIVPRLTGPVQAEAAVIGKKAVRAAWRMAGGSQLVIVCNLGDERVDFEAPRGRRIFVVGEERAGPMTAVYLGDAA